MSRIHAFFTWSKVRMFAPMIVSGVLMVWLLLRIDPTKVVGRWQTVNWLLLVLLIPILGLLNSSIRAGRLRLILRAQGITFPYLWLLLLQLKGSFLLSFLPGGVSSDIYRSYTIGREADRHLISITSVLLERAIGLGALILVSVTSLLIGAYALRITTYSNIVRPVILLTVAAFAVALLFFVIIRRGLIGRRQLPIPFWNRLQKISRQLSMLFGNSRVLGKLVLLSLCLQLSIAFWYFTVAQAMQVDISLLTFLISVPVIELLVSVPISVGGIGVRDAAMVFLLVPFGVSAEVAVSLSLLVAFTATLMGVLSGLSFFVHMPAQLDSRGQNLDGVTEKA